MDAHKQSPSQALSPDGNAIGRRYDDHGQTSQGDVAAVEHDRERRPSVASNVSVRSVLSEYHGTKLCSIKDALIVVCIFGILGLFVWILSSQSEHLVAFSEFVEDTGPVGHVIFFAIFMFVGLPFGYNWSTVVLLVAFAYGWSSLIDVNLGTGISALANYHSSRLFLAKCVNRRMKALGPKKRLYLQAAKHVIENHKAGYLMLLLLRMQPVLPFGMANTFLGALCRLGPLKYLSSTMLGTQIDIVKLISIAVMVRGAGSLEAATQGEAGTRSLIVTVVVTTCVIIGSIVFARYLAVRVLPSLISDDECIEVDEEWLESEQPKGNDIPVIDEKDVGETDDIVPQQKNACADKQPADRQENNCLNERPGGVERQTEPMDRRISL